VALQRDQILHAASDAVLPGGLLLVVNHGSAAPWSWDQNAPFPEPQTVLDGIGLDLSRWHTEFLGVSEQQLTGPENQNALVKDNVIALRKRA